jgi:hypothetical protein
MATVEPASSRDVRDTARYIEHLAKEMRRMTAEADLGFLAYLLAMVEDEAASTVRKLGERRGRGKD